MPTATVPSSLLSRNLKALSERNADLVNLLQQTPPAELEVVDTPQKTPAVAYEGRMLCSRHRPLDEAARLADAVDIVEHAVVVVLGFGAGYHVRRLAERMTRSGVIIVFEPDVALLRAVLEQIDHSGWLQQSIVVFITGSKDRPALAAKLQGAESIVAQGVEFVEHPASRARLGAQANEFAETFSEFVTATKTTLVTTLMRSVDTIRNLLLNLDHYAGGSGVAELKDAAAGVPGVIVSAGPSLHRNIRQLAAPGVRDRCVIIAVQTTLKPLLAAGVKPHFVTALDYHEISARFYEDLDGDDLSDVTLIADPKANPVVIDVFPGPVRCCANPFLDKLLGPVRREMGHLPAGATVAHLAVYVARHLGCDPIVLVGQDLGFPDGLYYAPGTAIHDVWAPELSPFNTIEMMEWQRIVRHRIHLHQTRDVHGKSIYTDTQMLTYLQQFERDFAEYERAGVRLIDATEGGVAKLHTTAMPLEEALERHATRGAPTLPPADAEVDHERLGAAVERVRSIRHDIAALGEIARQTSGLIERMIAEQDDQQKLDQHFKKVDANRRRVEQKYEAFELLNHLNQLGVYKRFKADRRLNLTKDLDPKARQRAQLERDLENVTWIADAAGEMIDQLATAERLLRGEPIRTRPRPSRALVEDTTEQTAGGRARLAALVPVDPHVNGLGIRRSLETVIGGRNVLQATLERLGRSTTIESIVLIVPRDYEVEKLIDKSRIGLPVEIEPVDGSPYGPEHEAIAGARLWSDTAWRGGIAGMSVYDELFCPQVMSPILERRGLTAALLVGPDWPFVDVTGPHGCDAVVTRHLEHPGKHNLVFTQAPPGLCGCVIGASLVREHTVRNRLSTIGGLLVYQPHAPQGDPIARDACVQIDHRVRHSLVRATFDSPRQVELLSTLGDAAVDADPVEIIRLLESAGAERIDRLPRHAMLEPGTARQSAARFRRRGPDRPPLTLELAARLFEQLGEPGDVVLTLHGAGDPLLHDSFDELIRMAKEAGVRAVHVRTDLLVDATVLNRLLASPVDVVSVDLHADRAATYEQMMGLDGFRTVLENIDRLVTSRRRLTAQSGGAALGVPWVVPRLRRCATTFEDIDSFFDRWVHTLGTAVIEGAPPGEQTDDAAADTLTPARTPPAVTWRELERRMVIRSTGDVPVSELDADGSETVGNVGDTPVAELWRKLVESRRRIRAERGRAALRTSGP